MKLITKAILQVMEDVKGIEKSMDIGTGNFAYKGVPDQQVKLIIGESMKKHGLVMLPVAIEDETEVSRWEETYNGQTKQKQSVFTKVKTKYLLIHESGESVELCGYGHGVDSQDKAAGKATTYALKYAMLYAFLVPTGKIDDTDTTHSNDIETPKTKPQKQEITEEKIMDVVKWFKSGKGSWELANKHYIINEKIKSQILDILDNE